MIPVLGKLKLFLTDKELIIPQGSLYIINSQEIHGMRHTEDTDIYKGYARELLRLTLRLEVGASCFNHYSL